MDRLWQDLSDGIRGILRRPGFTLVLVVTLALGIGANTAVFSVVHSVLLRPLPYPEPDRLQVIWSRFPTMDLMEFPSSWPEYVEFRDENSSFEEVAAVVGGARTLTGGERPERLLVTFATWTLWDVLDVEPAAGRVFREEEDVDGRDDVAVLGHGLWQRAFGGDPEVVGRTIRLDGRTVTVIGVMPPGFAFPEEGVDAYLPMGIDPADPPGRASHFATLVGRLAPDASLERARADLAGIMERWQADDARDHAWSAEFHPAFIRPLQEQIVGDVRASLLVLLGAVGLILLIACANVANLLLVRGEGRQREISIRAAMGAERRRVVRQLVTESLLVAFLGGAAGVVVGWAGVRGLVALAPESIPRLDAVTLSLPVLFFTLAVTTLAGVFFGLAPALQAMRVDVQGALRDEGRGSTAGRRRFRVRQLLVVSEMALAVVLLVGAGLLIQSFWRLQSVDTGFSREAILQARVSLPSATYGEAEQVAAFYRDLMPRLAALPGVSAAAAVRQPVLGESLPPNDILIENREPDHDGAWNADIQVVTPGYFELMGIPVVRGRSFEAADDASPEPLAVISESLARRLWPDRSPLNERIGQSASGFGRIVGVVGDVRHEGLSEEPRGTLYLLHSQAAQTWSPQRSMTLLLRTATEPLALVDAVRREVRAMDPDLPVYQVRTMEEAVRRATARERFTAVLQLLFAVVALALASVGIYGVVSYSVAQRTQEIGIRMALGAGRSEIVRLVLGQGMALAAVAVLIGIGGALAAGRALSSLLFGVSPSDPLTLGAVSGLLLAVALLACWSPARRASGVDPQEALRYE